MDDAYFARPFVDVEEERVVPCPHRYVHGGFEGTETRFSIYLPPAETYARRFISWIEGGVGGHEIRAAHLTRGLGSFPFAFSLGALLVESNGGHIAGPSVARSRGPGDASITTYRATAAAARFAREVARGVYGSEPNHGYLTGASGGAWRTILCMENTQNVWDGAVPYISFAGHGVLMPTLVENSARVLGPRLKQVVEAFEPGGHGNPFRDLDGRQREELGRLYRAGLQRGAEFQLAHPAIYLGAFEIFMTMHAEFDPSYFHDFWEQPGYAGHDGEVADAVVNARARITSLLTTEDVRARFGRSVDSLLGSGAGGLPRDARVAVEVDRIPAGELRGTVMTVGGASRPQRRLMIAGRLGNALVATAASAAADPLAKATPGQTVELDNRDYLAFCHAYRHQLDARSPECAQLTVGGQPIYPQRALSVDDVHVGIRCSGRFHGRMIYVDNLQDCCSSPLGALTYARRAVGADSHAARRLRLWLIENASHGQGSQLPQGDESVTRSRLIDWEGCVERALHTLIAWVEDGREPPSSTRYSYRDGQVVLPASARYRAGIQPVVSLSASRSSGVRAGRRVRLSAKVTVPPGGGRISAVEWDPEGRGEWKALDLATTEPPEPVRCAATHVYDQPGVYHPAVRAVSVDEGQRQPFGQVANLARATVVVDD